MTTLTATLRLNIDGSEYQKTVTFTPMAGRTNDDLFQWANQLIRPLERLEEEALRQSLNRDYDQWIKQRFIEATANQQAQAQTAQTARGDSGSHTQGE